MEYTVKQLAQLAGVSPRTLRWYDNLGLLRPARGENGWRRYGPVQVQRLQQILFYRTAGLPLGEIAAILDDDDFAAQQAMQTHLQGLLRRRAELDALIANAQKSLQTLKGETTMDDQERFEGFRQKLLDENEETYGAEVRERWGDEAADASRAKMMQMSKEDYARFEALSNEVNQAIKAAMATGDAAGEAAMQAARLHKEWLCFTWPQYNAQAHKNLAQMYVDDPRFTAYYDDAIAPGAAAFLRDAVAHFVDAGLAE